MIVLYQSEFITRSNILVGVYNIVGTLLTSNSIRVTFFASYIVLNDKNVLKLYKIK